ncbi:MAG: NfeD family protein [Bacteroidaceae bacterium]|nr:NfeD family protein [Bacteroidaceae bacterium]
MGDLMTWFEGLGTLHQVFWGCAIAGSLVFAIQAVLTLLGMDSTDVDVDVPDGDTLDFGGLSMFSVRNLVNFLVGFGWGGVSFYSGISNPYLLVLVAVVTGVLFVLMFFFIYKQTRKLESNGTFDIKNCEGKVADVYLRIPAKGEGRGKIQVSVNGSVHELDAMSNDDPIATGRKVRVVEICDGSSVIVETI